eukprot:12761726-Prorocentrum_lima.AAC.1
MCQKSSGCDKWEKGAITGHSHLSGTPQPSPFCVGFPASWRVLRPSQLFFFRGGVWSPAVWAPRNSIDGEPRAP